MVGVLLLNGIKKKKKPKQSLSDSRLLTTSHLFSRIKKNNSSPSPLKCYPEPTVTATVPERIYPEKDVAVEPE
eukprot:2747345-Ditylum_brightwellii.AAC.1